MGRGIGWACAPTVRVLTYLSTLPGKLVVPQGARAPGVFATTVVRADVAGHSVALRTPLPDFNWADRDSGWTYIMGDLVPAAADSASPSGPYSPAAALWRDCRTFSWTCCPWGDHRMI
ncbi:hypothetical protein AB0C34_04555 [Nocardia sp. NPDC049220]|uniref:hypothetical protein n=1 Tax=Nocardia sp. NPDC049220 TaxID=3155273 RepID=UPI0033EAAEBD